MRPNKDLPGQLRPCKDWGIARHGQIRSMHICSKRETNFQVQDLPLYAPGLGRPCSLPLSSGTCAQHVSVAGRAA
eukprot:1148558-Pelagomonas_calceolata.AAC.6